MPNKAIHVAYFWQFGIYKAWLISNKDNTPICKISIFLIKTEYNYFLIMMGVSLYSHKVLFFRFFLPL